MTAQFNGIFVPGYGNPNAKLVIVGEAPGAHEENAGYPFAGPSGKILDSCLNEAGIERSTIYLTNVSKIRPPENKIERLPETGHRLEEFIPILFNEIRDVDPNCVLAVGGTALQALTGYHGIEHYRGSILNSVTGHKVVPCLHPASLLHESDASGKIKSWKEIQFIKADVKRAAFQSEFKEFRLPQRQLEIARNSVDVIRFLDRYSSSESCSFDVETVKTIPICTALAFNESNAMSIPLFNYGLADEIPIHDRIYIWKALAEFFADTKIKFIAQNAKFDEKRQRQIGLDVHKIWFDTALAWHVLYSELPKRLDFITSILTDEPYYKEEGREFNPKRDKIDRLLLYNAKDAVVTQECANKIIEELHATDLYDFYFDKVHPLHYLYSEIEDVGILVDEVVRQNLHKKYSDLRTERRARLLQSIREVSGSEDFGVYSKQTGRAKRIALGDFNCDSPQQVAALIYGLLKCPLRKDTKEDTLKALANNAVKDAAKKEIINQILEDRKIGKTIGTYLEAKVSEDGRIHTQYNISGTETGRTSTSALKPPVSTEPMGIALQTMTKHEDVTLDAGGADLRSMFIADEGYVFVEADLSMAEDRVVVVLAKDWEAFDELNRKEYTYNAHGVKDDRHTKTAIKVCGRTFESITDYYRQIGKRIRHAGNYNMGKHTGMITLAKYGIFVSEYRVGQMLDVFHAENPKIRGVFHQEIQEALEANDCILVNPFGRRRIFFNKFPSEEIYKEAYAQIPQSTVSDQVKFAMLRIRDRLKAPDFYFIQESHDSFLSLVKEEKLPFMAPVVKEELEKPIDFRKCTLSRDFNLVIPADVKVGKRWVDKSGDFPDGLTKWKVG